MHRIRTHPAQAAPWPCRRWLAGAALLLALAGASARAEGPASPVPLEERPHDDVLMAAESAAATDTAAPADAGPPPPLPRRFDAVPALVRQLQQRFPQPAGAPVILIDADRQELLLVERLAVTRRWRVSTAEAGLGSARDSLRTPTGAHRLAHKIGHGAAVGTVFDARRNTGRRARILTAPGARSGLDRVTTRLMWLDGLERGHNQGGTVDSRQRLIYIHGTDEEGRVGTPASLGCIRMRNQDVIELFDRVREDTLVYIAERLG